MCHSGVFHVYPQGNTTLFHPFRSASMVTQLVIWIVVCSTICDNPTRFVLSARDPYVHQMTLIPLLCDSCIDNRHDLREIQCLMRRRGIRLPLCERIPRGDRFRQHKVRKSPHWLILRPDGNVNASSIALYGLILFYGLTKDELVGRRPLAKFLSIKLIVMATFYQSFVVCPLFILAFLEA